MPEITDAYADPDLKVGHAGLYVDNELDDKIVDPDTVVADIILGRQGAGKTLINCEKGIKAFVKDQLARQDNHLPNSETGVWIHYLTEGIIRDYGRTWDETPLSLRGKATPVEKARSKGIRRLNKKQKNELLAKLTYAFYEGDVNSGKITQQDAFASMSEAAATKKELEDAGYFLSPNKTQGIALFDWKSEVLSYWGGDESKLKIYNRHSIVPTVPNLIGGEQNKLAMKSSNKFVKKEMDKSIVADMSIHNYKEFMDMRIENWADFEKQYTTKAYHIAKINQSGKMKDRWFVVDAIRNSDKAQVLVMWDGKGKDGILV